MVLLQVEETEVKNNIGNEENEDFGLFHYLKEDMTQEELKIFQKEIEIITDTPFVSKYVKELSITDIIFDGTTLYVEDKMYGLRKADIQPTIADVEKFLIRVNNAKGKRFDTINTRMNVVLGYLRISAVHSVNNIEGHSFSIRVARPYKVVDSLENVFIDVPAHIRKELAELLSVLVKAKIPIVLSGETGAGKTEMQKVLIGTVVDIKDGEKPTHQIVLVEDTPDSHIKQLYPNSCIRSWITDERFTPSMAVEEGMRHNPDIFMIAEIRGAEAGAAFDAVKTNHGLISTVHSLGAADTPSRLMPLIRLSPQYQTMTDSLLGREIARFFPICIHMVKERRTINGETVTVRYPSQIAEILSFNEEKGFEANYLFKQDYRYNDAKNEYEIHESLGKLSEDMLQRIANQQLIHRISDTFK